MLRITPRAAQDLDEVLEYIAEHRPLTAKSVAARIREKLELLAKQPLLGEHSPEFGSDYRRFTVERWVILYKLEGGAVEIHRIVDGARDLGGLLP
jgi:toxin ParE1/3/4